MITVLATNAYKAAYKAKQAAVKPNKHLPVTSHLLIRTHEGRVLITPFLWDAEERTKASESLPARVDSELATCVPARAFVDWLRVTQEKPTRANPHGADQITLELDEQTQTLRIKAGNTRTEFKCIAAQEWLSYYPAAEPMRP